MLVILEHERTRQEDPWGLMVIQYVSSRFSERPYLKKQAIMRIYCMKKKSTLNKNKPAIHTIYHTHTHI